MGDRPEDPRRPVKTIAWINVLTCLSPSDKVALEDIMPYERSQALEKRLQELLRMLRDGRPSAQTLAGRLDISQPTLARCLTALRRRGYAIRAVKDESGWSYRLGSEARESRSQGLQ